MPRVLGDRARIREVFYNLLSNAVKFSDKRKGRIEIGCNERRTNALSVSPTTAAAFPARN